MNPNQAIWLMAKIAAKVWIGLGRSFPDIDSARTSASTATTESTPPKCPDNWSSQVRIVVFSNGPVFTIPHVLYSDTA